MTIKKKGNNKIKYQKAVVSYHDILGFSQMVINKERDLKDILEPLEYVNNEYKKYKKMYPKRTSHYFTMSDSIVNIELITDLRVTDPIDCIYHSLMSAMYRQFEFMQHGFCLRGGITYGELYLNPNKFHMAVGPALIEAIKIEERIAIYPRIVIDINLVKELRQIKRKYKSNYNIQHKMGYIFDLMKKDTDGQYYVDWLNNINIELDFILDFYFKVLPLHKTLIEDNLKNNKNCQRVLEKYEWLKKYHNDCVGRISKKWLRREYIADVGEDWSLDECEEYIQELFVK